jgi:hypothetical protein
VRDAGCRERVEAVVRDGRRRIGLHRCGAKSKIREYERAERECATKEERNAGRQKTERFVFF